ncbi:hypothetical protein AMS68_005973 [Peltaster fructicola]|uniref:FAD-binding domain-containing protein n=1 Tax=Peltaster fructicola TaxID=286661 RepID=A0A6H0Y0J6_9PEZI|nr:hypothetical protein AMS68_005973 [Peltaster fructicola]
MSASKDFEIAIVGSGIAGMSLAAALVHRGIKVQVYEAAHHFGEIGAGVAFTPNATQAMTICSPNMHDGFLRVATPNLWPSKANVYFDFYDGFGDGKGNAPKDKLFTSTARHGMQGCHRAHFLDELVKLVPPEIAHFGKRLDDYIEREDGRIVMHFRDGTTAEADAIIGADGIKSKVREIMFGATHPCAQPSFTQTCAYRGVVPMELAIKAIGEEKAQNSSLYMGPGGHVLTLPINQGKLLNIVAFHRSWENWEDSIHLTKPAKREDALRDFATFGDDVKQLLRLTNENLDVWAIFDTGDNPPPYYNKGRVCIHGDSAHATTPHHGSGAGFCVEGSAIMAELLGNPRVKTAKDLEVVFKVYNAVRRQRTMWLVQSSRVLGKAYDWQLEGTGRDAARIEAELAGRALMIDGVDVAVLCETAQIMLDCKLDEAALKA